MQIDANLKFNVRNYLVAYLNKKIDGFLINLEPSRNFPMSNGTLS